jgi:hypothetical protein
MSIFERLRSMPGIPLLAALAIIFGALSSVTPGSGQGALSGIAQREQQGPNGTTSSDPSGKSDADGSRGAGVDGSGSGRTTTTTKPGTSGSGPKAAGETLARGILPDRIKIGYLVPDRDWDGVFAALGTPASGGVGFGNQREMIEAVVDDINAHGGMGGRRIEPYYFVYSFNRTLSSDSSAAQNKEACTYWTQDSGVFAVVQIGFENWGIADCLTEHKVVHVNTSTFVSESHYAKIADYYYNSSFNSLNRQARDYVHGLAAQGFFGKAGGWGPASKIGLIQVDPGTVAPDFAEAVKKGLEPELARRGLKITTRALIELTSNWTNIVVQFRNAGVTHVLFAVSSPLHYSLFMQAAENQKYTPWYGISTAAAPGVLLQYTVPANQLKKSMGPGWAPLGDVAPSENPYPPTAYERRCYDLMEKAGQKTSDVLARAIQVTACATNWFFQEGLDRARPNLTLGGLAKAVEKGEEFYAMRDQVMPYRFGPDRVKNGVASFRPLIFDVGCECFKYTGKIQPMP